MKKLVKINWDVVVYLEMALVMIMALLGTQCSNKDRNGGDCGILVFFFLLSILTNDRRRELENQIDASVIAFFGKFSLKGLIRVGIVGAFSQGLRTLQLVRTGDQPVQQLS